MNEFLSAAWAV